MPITNGFDNSRVLPILMARKGWEQPTQSEFTPTLDAASTACVSGMFYNYDHAACDPMSIWSVQADSRITDVNFNAYLGRLKQQIALNSLNAVFRESAVIESPQILFEKQFRTQYIPIPNTSKFCGWQMKIANGDYSVKIDSVAFMTTAPCTFTIYLYNDLRADAVYTKQITVAKGYDQTIINIDDLIINRLNDTNKGSVFFIGYYQDELQAQGVQAVDVFLNWWHTYNMIGYQGFEAISNYANKTFIRDQYVSNYRTYGFNMELSSYYDHTNTIIRNAYAFDRLQGLMMTYKCIEETVNSNRSNLEQRISGENFDIMYSMLQGGYIERQGNRTATPSKMSLRSTIESEIDRVRKTFFDNSKIETSIPPVNVNDYYVNPHWGNQI
jgi:hypothetical protein